MLFLGRVTITIDRYTHIIALLIRTYPKELKSIKFKVKTLSLSMIEKINLSPLRKISPKKHLAEKNVKF